MKVEYSAQYQCACVVVEPGDTFEAIEIECFDQGAVCDWECGEDDPNDLVVRLPGRPQECYSPDALRRSLTSTGNVP